MAKKILPLHQCTTVDAQKLADLESVRNDLKRVIVIAQRLLKIWDDSVLKDACLISALMLYRRCFTSGLRAPIDRTNIATLGPDTTNSHDYLMAQANKLVAHSVNSFEQAKVALVVEDDHVKGISVLSTWKDALGKQGVKDWIRLVQIIIDHVVSPRIRTLEDTILASAKALPIDEIKSAPTLNYTVPSASEAGKARKRARHQKPNR